jgi:uncharacterized membrane protein YkvA (DUF1232 family)
MAEIPFLDKILDRLIKEAEKITSSNGAISKLIDDVFLKIGLGTEFFYNLQDSLIALVRMLKAWSKGEYKNIAPGTIVAVVATLLYFMNPFDLIPDYIPILGQIDDILVLSYLVKYLNKEIERFMAWEKENEAMKG